MVKRPYNVFNYIKRRFSWEGFCKVNILDACVEAGFSKAEAKRLFNGGAIKVWDTRVTEDGGHLEWYKRRANLVELAEPDDVILCGNPKAIIIKQIPFSIPERIYYHLRDLRDIAKDKWEDKWLITYKR